MSRFLSLFAQSLTPYVYGEQPKDKKYIKLNTNENPYPVSESVIRAVRENAETLRLYPDPEATELRKAASAYYNEVLKLEKQDALTKENVFVGNGSDEVLAFVFPAFFKGGKVAVNDISYSFYPVYAEFFETETEIVPLKNDFTVNIDAYMHNGSSVGLSEDVTAILIANPNAPTSIALHKSELIHIIEANPDRIVVVDEAYIDFGGETLAGLVNKYDNLLVVQTMSKSRCLAGMRVGIAIGSAELIKCLETVKNCFNSYTADSLAIAAGTAAMKDIQYFNETRNKIIATRERTIKELRDLDFNVMQSMTNFLFVSHRTKHAADLFVKLREMGILVRYFKNPQIDNYLRISIGTDEEMDALVSALKIIL